MIFNWLLACWSCSPRANCCFVLPPIASALQEFSLILTEVPSFRGVASWPNKILLAAWTGELFEGNMKFDLARFWHKPGWLLACCMFRSVLVQGKKGTSDSTRSNRSYAKAPLLGAKNDTTNGLHCPPRRIALPFLRRSLKKKTSTAQ